MPGWPTRERGGHEHGRPAGPGRLALPFLRGQPRASLRPGRLPRIPPQHPRRDRRPLRGGRHRSGWNWSPSRARARSTALNGRDRTAALSMPPLSRRQYAEMFGPTAGRPGAPGRHRPVRRGRARPDRRGRRLRQRGEVWRRQGDPRRDGRVAGRAGRRLLDLVLTNALLLDPLLGVIKADIGVKHGRIVGIGHAGNPGIQSGLGSALPIRRPAGKTR